MCMLVARVLMRTTDKLREVGDTARGFAALDILEQWSKVKKSSASAVIKVVVTYQSSVLHYGNKIKNILEEVNENK